MASQGSRALDPFARRIKFRMQTQDVRKFLISDAVRRAEGALERAGGKFVRGASPRKRIKRWCVNRSPHVNKTSREHFWMITHTRIVEWDAGKDVDIDAPSVIAMNLPGIMATRVEDNMPALMALPVAWDLLHPSKETLQNAAAAEAAEAAARGDFDEAVAITERAAATEDAVDSEKHA